MNTNQGALYFGAGIDLNQWRRDIDSMRRDIAGLNQNVTRETRNMDSAFKNLSIGIAGYFSIGAIKNFITELINVRGEFQKTEIAYTTMLGSVSQAKSLMADMVELAAKTPFSLMDVTDGAKRLLAFQVPAAEVLDTLTRLGNVSAGLSVPISRLILVYGQVKAKGRLMGDDLRQFTEAGIPMVAELAEKFNKTTAEISAMVTAGKIGFKDVQDVLFSMTNEGGMFFNLMEKQSKSLSGQVANLGDAWDQMLNKIGESQEGLLSDGIQSLIYMVEHYQDVLQILSTLVAAYGTYKAVLITVNALQKAQIWAEGTIAAVRFAQGISGMTRAQLLFNAAASANPYVLLASGIAAVIAALVYFRTASTDAKEEAEKLTAALEYQKLVSDSVAGAYKRSSEAIVGSIEKEIAILKSSYSSAEMRKKAYENLTKINKAFVGTVDGEFRATVKLNEAYSVLVSRLKELAIAKGKAALLEELSKKKAQADLDLVLKQDSYEKQREKNLKLRAENAKKDNIGAGMYREFKLEEGIDYSTYNPVKEAKKAKALFDKQVEILANDVTKGIVDATKKNDKELKDAWGNIGEAALESGPKKGTEEWYKGEIDRLEALKAKAVVGSKAWNAYRLQIEKYNDLISPKKDKTDNKQLAEIFPDGSIKDLERKAQLITDALATVENGVVKIRKLDQYGNDKDKKGNALLTGENVSIEEAKNRLVKINEALEAKRKEIEVKSFQERIDEAERQWNNYYKMAEFYGKESADAQYKELFKGSTNYLQYLENQEQALKDLQAQGLLSNQQKEDLVFLGEKISSLNGATTPLEGFKRSIDDTLKSLPSLVDQLDALNNFEDTSYKKAGGNTSYFLQQRKLIEENRQNIIQQQKDLYREFAVEQETFEQKKIEIEKKYNLIRQQIGANKALPETERLRLLDAAGKEEAKEYGSAFLDTFKKTKLWEKIFGNMNTISKREVEKLIPVLKAQIAELIKLDAPIEEIERYKQKLEELEGFTSGNSPVEKLVASFKKLTKQAKTADGKIDWRNFAKNYEGFADSLSASVGSAIELGDALGFMGNTDGMQETIDNLMETTKGLVNAIAGYASGDYAQMAGGIIQATIGLTKMLSGDDDKSFTIRSWERDVSSLKVAYEQLNREIAKTAGSEQFSKQKELVTNLENQKRALQAILKLEKEKKKPDSTKVSEYENQIAQINGQIEDLVDNFLDAIAQTDFKDLATQLSDALTEAFGKGEDAALAYEKVVDDVMRNAVKNALKIAILEPATKKIVDSLINSMGYGSSDNSAIKKQITDAENLLNAYQKESSQIFANGGQFSYRFSELSILMKELKAKIDLLKSQAVTSQSNGAFDGLTKEERDAIKAQGIEAMNQYTAALQQYEDLFGAASENAQGLKGDIKGITEKTAGALEAQFNALRINVVAMFQLMKQNHTVQNAHTVLLSQIEVNTRRLHSMDKTLAEMNAKMKKSLAGVP